MRIAGKIETHIVRRERKRVRVSNFLVTAGMEKKL